MLILAPESLYGLNTLSKSFEGLNALPRGLCGGRGHPRIPKKLRMASVSIACERFMSKLRHNAKILQNSYIVSYCFSST